MKNFAKQLVVRVLLWQLRRLRRKHDITVIAVAGSIGKTSTKLTIANVLKKYYRVQVQEGNYNDIVTVPLIFFGTQNPPRVTSPLAWMKIFIRNELLLKSDYSYDLVIVELGTDGPGQMKQFKPWIRADIGILTSIGHEHMEYFSSLEAVAQEELVIDQLSDQLIVNQDDVPTAYRKQLATTVDYGTTKTAQVYVESIGADVMLSSMHGDLTFTSQVIGSHLHKTFGAALAVCGLLGIKIDEKLTKAFEAVPAVSGRMQVLPGKNNSLLIDDTYNNVSSEPAIAALKVLYDQTQTKKIAVLGNMNELGAFSPEMHTKVGKFCDPRKLTEVITIGPDANTFLAEAARANGNTVSNFNTPYEIADYLKSKVDKHTVVLFKGSQNKVYLEEAVKPLLAHASDAVKLVRQSPEWLRKKRKSFITS